MVGADGARSTVRNLLSLPFEGHTWPERFVATNVSYDFERYGFEPANMVADPVNWAVVARLGRENLWRVTFEEDANLPEDDIPRRIAERYSVLLPDPKAPYRIVAYSPYRVHERCAPTFRVGRTLLAGDAAHACNPCGGMGLTGGVIDAAALSEVLAAVLAGRAPESVLDFYATERRRVFLEVSSPIASDFKRRMSEKDLTRQRADFEEFRRQAEDPARQFALDGTQQAGRRPAHAREEVPGLMGRLRREAPDGVTDVIGDEQRTFGVMNDIDGAALSLLFFIEETGQDIHRLTRWLARTEGKEDHLVTALWVPVPGSMLSDEKAPGERRRE